MNDLEELEWEAGNGEGDVVGKNGQIHIGDKLPLNQVISRGS